MSSLARNPRGANSTRSTDYTNVLHTLIKSVKLLQEATETTNLPVPSGPLAGVAIDRLESIKALKSNRDVGEELAEKIVHQVGTIYHELARPTVNEDPNLTRASVMRYTKALADAHNTLNRLSNRGTLGKSLLRGRDRRELLRVMLGVDTEFNSFMESLGKEQNPGRDNRRSLHITPTALQDFGIQGRPSSPTPSHEALYPGARQRSHCWPGTRIPILDEIDHWGTTTTGHATPGPSSHTSLIYWLADIPGSGKSTIAASLAEEWREKGILGGYYDFGTSNLVHSPGKRDSVGIVPGIDDLADAVCEAWATQLGAAYPELSSPILRALSEIHRSTPSSSARSFSNQLNKLILAPLKTLSRARHDLQPHSKVLFVLDSIEECPPPHRAAILQAIKAVNPAHGGVKFFLVSGLPTTDAESDIAAELLECPPSLVTRGSININSASNMADILLYLTSQFQVHAAQFNNHPQFRSALIEPTIRVLAKRAEGGILWAKLAFEMLLLGDNPTKMLLNLVEEDSLSEIGGLYLELLLTAQTNLDATNEKRGQDNKGPTEAFPKNALAMVLSAVGYSMEALSVSTLAELTGLGLERTSIVLELLNIVLDQSRVSPTARSTTHLPPSPSRTTLSPPSATISLSPVPNSKKRASSTPRKSSSFSPTRQKTKRPGSAGASKSPVSPSSLGGFSDAGPSISGTLLLPPRGSSPRTPHFPSGSEPEEVSSTDRVVRIRHSTFREWIRLPHPPTLLSGLTGRAVAAEDDLRFIIAPSREGAHAMFAKGCFTIIRTTTLSPDQIGREAEEPIGEDRGEKTAQADLPEEGLSFYAYRYWAYHCAELLDSFVVENKRSSIFMSIASVNSGARWKGIRGDMLEFFTRKLVWWVDVSIALNSVALVKKGLQRLQGTLEKMTPPEEDIKSTVEQLTQWTHQALRLLEHPHGFPEEERNAATSLVYKYYGEELSQRATLAELKRQQAQEALERENNEKLLPPPPLSDHDHTSPKKTELSSSERSSSVGKAASTSTKSSSISIEEDRGRGANPAAGESKTPTPMQDNVATVLSPPSASKRVKKSLSSPEKIGKVADPAPLAELPNKELGQRVVPANFSKPKGATPNLFPTVAYFQQAGPKPASLSDPKRNQPTKRKGSVPERPTGLASPVPVSVAKEVEAQTPVKGQSPTPAQEVLAPSKSAPVPVPLKRIDTSNSAIPMASSPSNLFPSLAFFQQASQQSPVSASPLTDPSRRSQTSRRKSSATSASAPTRSIPPLPSPMPVIAAPSSEAPKLSAGEEDSSSIADILNMITF